MTLAYKQALDRIQECIETKSPILDLGGLALSDTDLPDELWELEWLEELNFRNYVAYNSEDKVWVNYDWEYEGRELENHTISMIPIKIKELTQLRYLDFANCKISKIENLQGSSSLQDLDLNFNQINKIENLEGLINLQNLNLSFNQIDKIENLESLINLKNLDLSFNQINKIENLDRLSNLKGLQLDFNQISKIENLGSLSNLQNLNLNSNQIRTIENLESLSNLQMLNLNSNVIGNIENLKGLFKLEYLDLSSNKLGIIIKLEYLIKLKFLYISNNDSIFSIKHLSYLQHLETLDVSSIGVTDISLLVNLTQLTTLCINNSQVKDFSVLNDMKKLTFLDISKNEIKDVSPISNLTQLKELKISELTLLGDTNILRPLSDLKFVKKLLNLTALNVSKNNISDLIPLKKLNNLHTLDISENNISDLMPLKKLNNLKTLNASFNKISNLAKIKNLVLLETLDTSSNEIIDISALSKLKKLRYVILEDNKIEEISPLFDLDKVEKLHVGNNNISNIAGIDKLKKLKKLHLRKNRIQNVDSLKDLPRLSELDISGNEVNNIGFVSELKELSTFTAENNKIENVDSLIELGNLKTLNINGNNIETSIEIIEKIIEKNILTLETLKLDVNTAGIPTGLENNIKLLIQYFKENKISQKTLKIFLLGNTRSGKSQFLNYLRRGKYNNNSKSTDGMAIEQFQYKIDGENYYIICYDLGGQDYYHGTHNIFLDSNALYLVFWHPNSVQEEGEKYQHMDLKYWLGNINYFVDAKKEKKPTIWTIQSRSDDDGKNIGLVQPRVYINNELIELYKVDTEGQYYLSIKEANRNPWKQEWGYFKYHLDEKIKKIAVNSGLTIEMKRVRDEVLPQLRKEKLFLKEDDFVKRCNNILQTSSNFSITLIYLEKLGQIIFYNDKNDSTKKYICPQPETLSKMIFEVLNKNNSNDSKGEFTLSKNKSFNKYLANVQEEDKNWIKQIFIELLEANRIIFKKPKAEGIYVVPQYLPVQELDNHLQYLILPSLVIKYQGYMPFWRISSFIAVKSSYFSGSENYWRYGMLYEDKENNCRIFIKVQRPLIDTENKEQKIFIHLTSSKNANRALEGMFKYFAYVENTGSEKKSSIMSDNIYIKDIELSENNEDFFSIRELLIGMDEKRDVKSVDNKYKKIPAIFYPLLGKKDFRPKKIFFSYSHADSEYRDELEAHFSALKKSNLVETWHDLDIKPGDNWDNEIMEKLEAADIVLGLISSNFMNSNYIWNKEVPKMTDKKFIPIFLKSCDFDGSFFDMKQGIPFDNNKSEKRKSGIKWIVSSHQKNRDEAYTEVVERIKSLLKNEEK